MKCDKCGYDDLGTVPDNKSKFWADPRFQILAEVDKLLNGSKTWGGMGWVYLPIHPYKYRPVAEMIDAELDKLRAEYGGEP